MRGICVRRLQVCFHLNSVTANRETAVVRTLVISGVMHVVTLNCSTGALDTCTCDTDHGQTQTGELR